MKNHSSRLSGGWEQFGKQGGNKIEPDCLYFSLENNGNLCSYSSANRQGKEEVKDSAGHVYLSESTIREFSITPTTEMQCFTKRPADSVV